MAKGGERLDLAHIRATLIRQEDTILFGLIERAQFKRNAPAYTEGAGFLEGTGIKTSFTQYLLQETESIHATARRYTSPEEKPFTPKEALPSPILPPMPVPDIMRSLQEIDVNVNGRILGEYVERVLPSICKEGDDGQYGCSAVCDIQVLQALSKRIHYGTFVAESKFLSDPEGYSRLITAGDREGIMQLLTNSAVEESVIRRVQLKATAYGQEISDGRGLLQGSAVTADDLKLFKVNPQLMGELYRDFIIPLTKEVEVEYLLQRLNSGGTGDLDASQSRL